MSQAKNSFKCRDWAITVYPLKYEGATSEQIEEAEAGWLHDQEHGPIVFEPPLVYLYGCLERGDENHKLHCHYRAYFKNQVRIATIQKLFGKNIKAKRVEDSDAYELYIRKEGKFADKAKTHVAGPWTYGDRPTQGKAKGAWEDILDLVKAGASNAQILEAHPFAAVQMRGVSVLRETFSPPPPMPYETPYAYQREVMELCSGEPVPRRWIWVWSRTYGTGKSQLGVALTLTLPTLIASYRDPRSTLMMFRPEHHKVIVFDLPRAYRLNPKIFKFWEELSDHKFIVSDKFEATGKFIKAHLVILTNRPKPTKDYDGEEFDDRIKEIEATKVY